MSHGTSESGQPPEPPLQHPSIAQGATNPFLDDPPPKPYDNMKSLIPEQTVSPPPVTSASIPSSSSCPPPQPVSVPLEEEKQGTRVMGTPAIPTVHPNNEKAALWGATGEEVELLHHPYLQYTPIAQRHVTRQTGATSSRKFCSCKAKTMAFNIWCNLKTGTSVSGAAWGKVKLRAKAITRGGFQSLYRQTFNTFPNEMLRKAFACYLSTSTGPVAGTLYLSTIHAAFCSDRPLSFTAPSGQVTWSYYKLLIPLSRIGEVNPVVMREDPAEKYLQIVTLEGQDFWFMGFVNYEKACRHLTESAAAFPA